MEVKLVSYSQPTSDFGHAGLRNVQELIAYCARVSNPDNQFNKATSEKLINYLVKNAHWSPLEMVSATMEITTTRDIARQMLRHRSFSFQEFSQRYADPTKSLDFVLREARFQDSSNRQNSITLDMSVPINKKLQEDWDRMQQEVIDAATASYRWAIINGIAKEQARVVLPEGNTVSRLYMSGTLRSWIHFIELRSGNGTQKEHQEVALACAKAISQIFPMSNTLIQGENTNA
jgi:thymidylate synthase (FAD)